MIEKYDADIKIADAKNYLKMLDQVEYQSFIEGFQEIITKIQSINDKRFIRGNYVWADNMTPFKQIDLFKGYGFTMGFKDRVDKACVFNYLVNDVISEKNMNRLAKLYLEDTSVDGMSDTPADKVLFELSEISAGIDYLKGFSDDIIEMVKSIKEKGYYEKSFYSFLDCKGIIGYTDYDNAYQMKKDVLYQELESFGCEIHFVESKIKGIAKYEEDNQNISLMGDFVITLKDDKVDNFKKYFLDNYDSDALFCKVDELKSKNILKKDVFLKKTTMNTLSLKKFDEITFQKAKMNLKYKKLDTYDEFFDLIDELIDNDGNSLNIKFDKVLKDFFNVDNLKMFEMLSKLEYDYQVKIEKLLEIDPNAKKWFNRDVKRFFNDLPLKPNYMAGIDRFIIYDNAIFERVKHFKKFDDKQVKDLKYDIDLFKERLERMISANITYKEKLKTDIIFDLGR